MSEHTKGPWLREGNLVYTLQHYGWRKGVEEFENRITIRVSGSPRGAQNEEVEATAVIVQAAPTMLSALEAVRDLMAPESGIVLTTLGPSTKEARERIDRTFQLVADALHAAKGQQDTAPDEPSTPR